VPLTDDGSTITDDTRIAATLPTIVYAIRHKAKSFWLRTWASQGQTESKIFAAPGGSPSAQLLDKSLGEDVNVAFAPDCIGEVASEMARQLESGQVLLLENLRFHAEEEANDPAFSKALASLADVYVNDAFGSAHRAHASTEGITHFLKPAVAGLLMERKLPTSARPWNRLKNPRGIIGGSKISGKIDVIDNLLDKVDTLVIVAAWPIHSSARWAWPPQSLVEEDKIDMAKAAIEKAKAKGVRDCCCPSITFWPISSPLTPKPSRGIARSIFPPTGRVWTLAQVHRGHRGCGFDRAHDCLERPGWRLRVSPLRRGTNAIAHAVAANRAAISIIGGGDSVSAINQAGVADQIITSPPAAALRLNSWKEEAAGG